MYIATIPNRNSPPAILLRESIREGNKVSTKTLANLSHLSPVRIEALKSAFKGDFDNLTLGELKPTIGPTFGTYFVLNQLMCEAGITKALGKDPMAQFVLFLAITRLAHNGSRSSAVAFAKQHAIHEILGIEKLTEDKLYQALDWASEHQEEIELKLYKNYLAQHKSPPSLVLYDVTSSYFEGQENELAEYGYNRDGKKGKKQIVIGLLADKNAEPLAIRVFKGNTSDPTTVVDQINKLKQAFKITEVIFVGDRGMVKTKAQEALGVENYNYITALTDAQTRKLLSSGAIQLNLFDQKLSEVEAEGKRYVLIRNDHIRDQKLKRLETKLNKLQDLVTTRNEKVQNSKRAKGAVGLSNIGKWLKKNRLDMVVNLELQEEMITYVIDEVKKSELIALYGCYTLVTDVASDKMQKEEIKESYKSLQKVEQDFRALKSGFLEVRPIFVRKTGRTKGHVFIAMLALKLVRLMRKKLEGTNLSIDEALNALMRHVFLVYQVNDKETLRLPNADETQQKIFDAMGINLSHNKDKDSNIVGRKKK